MIHSCLSRAVRLDLSLFLVFASASMDGSMG